MLEISFLVVMANVLCTDTNCYVSTQLIQETMDQLLKGKTPIVPKFVITFGPPGSGKSSLIKQALYNNLIMEENTVTVNVDKIIETFEPYQNDLRAVRDLVAAGKIDEARSLASKVYEKYRQTGATFSDFVLNHALLLRYHVIWETTGNSIRWSLPEIERVKRYGYKVILVYPFVDLESLKKRVEIRSYESLRFVDPQFIEMVAKNAQENFVELSKYVDEAYIYDNTVPAPDWTKALVEMTTVFDWRKGVLREFKCDNKRLKELSDKMNQVLVEFLIEKCK